MENSSYTDAFLNGACDMLENNTCINFFDQINP